MQAREDCLAYQEVADVEFNHLRDGGEYADSVKADAMARMDLKPYRRRLDGAPAVAGKFRLSRRHLPG